MEFAILPILALLGLVFLVDFGGDDDEADNDDGDVTPPQGDYNYMQFGSEDDVTSGTDAADAMYLNEGDDLATGGAGDDKIFLGNGQDATVILTEEGDFTTEGMAGDDFIRGGAGRDILVDSLGSNTIYGDTGYDRMNSVDAESDEGTPDTMFGGFGQDVLFADNGDVLSGGAQDDRFQITVTDDMDPVTVTDFTAGDTLFLRDPDGGYQIAERISTSLSETGEDTNVLLDDQVVMVLQGVTEMPEGAIGNPTSPPIYGRADVDEAGNVLEDDYDDDIIIDDYAHAVFSRDGNDTISFAKGADTEGRDMQIIAGAGDDVVTSGLGDDSISGGLGNDTIFGGGGSDEISGGYGNDVINTVDASDLAADGTALSGDIVDGGAGNDTITFDNGDAVTGDVGVDSFIQEYTVGDANYTAINDFDPLKESIVIQTTTATGPLGFEADVNGAGTFVTIDTVQVMFLVNVTPVEAAAADITLVQI